MKVHMTIEHTRLEMNKLMLSVDGVTEYEVSRATPSQLKQLLMLVYACGASGERLHITLPGE